MAASQQEIQAILEMAAGAYGANSKVLDSMTRRESSYRDVVNDWDSNAKAGTPSAGILQFIEPTYRSFSKEARKANPAAWKGVADNWRDPRAQALTAAWAITNGKGGHWATYKAALADAGAKNAKGQKAPSIPGAAPSPGYGLLEAAPGKSATAGLLEDGFLKSFLERRAARQPMQQVAPAPAGPNVQTGDGAHARRKGETGQQYLDRVLQAKFGLQHDPGNSQTTGGKHAEGSGHRKGTATDYGDARNDPKVLAAADDWLDANKDALGLSFAWYGAQDDPGHADHLHAQTARSIRGRR